jgi:hypothetical protein
MKVEKAYLVEIENYTTDVSQKEEGSNKVEVQFNPETLQLTHTNQNSGGDQPNGSSAQNVGNLTSKLSLELLFDTTENGDDVRRQTEKVAYFLMPKEDANRTPPRTRFQWGSFIFEGIIDSLRETLDYFSEEGVPMRATLSLEIQSDNIVFLIDKLQGSGQGAGGEGSGVTTPLQTARPGDSVQALAGRAGRSADWKKIAEANNIDDPLRLPVGALLNLKI